VLGVLPGLGFAALAAGTQVLFGEPARVAVVPLVSVGFVLLAAGVGYIVFEPRWWGAALGFAGAPRTNVRPILATR
jgi:hypothetical protein